VREALDPLITVDEAVILAEVEGPLTVPALKLKVPTLIAFDTVKVPPLRFKVVIVPFVKVAEPEVNVKTPASIEGTYKELGAPERVPLLVTLETLNRP